MTTRFICRRAAANDTDGIAAVFSPSFRLLTFLPMLHTEEEDRWFIENVTLKECEVTLAEGDGHIVSFLARAGEEIRMLYTHPDYVGSGAGGLLMETAKMAGTPALELWCFQANERAPLLRNPWLRAIRFTEGADNEERTPDVRYRWQR